MKLKGYKTFEEKEQPSEWYDKDYDDLVRKFEDDEDNQYGRPSHSSNKIHGGYDTEDVSTDDMEHLYYLIRNTFKNIGITVVIEKRGLDLSLCIMLNKVEKIKNLVTIFNTVNKIKNDILPQYDCELEMWQPKDGITELIFGFFYEDGHGDDGDPF